MKANFRIVALALAAMALTVACNNNPTEEVNEDTMPIIDTTIVDSVVEEPVVEEPVAEEPVKKAATPAKKKSKVEQVVEDVKTVQQATLQVKKDAKEVASELKQGEGNSTQATQIAPKKQSAADAFKKKN